MKKQLLLKEAGDFIKYFRVNLPNNMELIEIEKMQNTFAVFEELLKFIGSNMSNEGEVCDNYNCDKHNKIGIAYNIIRRRTDKIIGISPLKKLFHPYKTSKKELQSIKTIYKKNIFQNLHYLKIPYRIDFIFEATIKTIEDIEKSGIMMPSSLSGLVGQLYKYAFYIKHYELFEANYGAGGSEKTEIMVELYDDFNSEHSALNTKFK